MNSLKPLAARIPLIAALLIVSVNSAFPPPVLAQENPGKISFQPSVIPQVTLSYEDYSFKFQLQSYFIRVRPFVIFHGEYYGLQQIITYLQNNYPQIKYSWLLNKARNLIHYGYNLTQLPQKVADGLDYVGFRLVDLNFPPSWFNLETVQRPEYNITLIHIAKAHLTFSFEDLYPYGYSVTHVNSTYILVGGVNGQRDLHIDPITYSSPTITVIGGSQGSPYDFKDIWAEDQANGWGVVHNNNNSDVQFQFDAKIVFGNGTEAGETWFNDTSKQIVFSSDLGTCMEGKAYSHLRFGEPLDLATKSVRYGLDFRVLSMYGSTTFLRSVSTGSSVEIYGGRIQGYDTAYHDTCLQIGSYNWKGKIYHVLLDRIFIYSTYADVYGLTFFKTQRQSLSILGGTQEKIELYESKIAFYISSIAGITTQNVMARGCETLASFYYAYGNTYFVDVDSDSWSFVWSNSPQAHVYRNHTYNLRVTWENNSIIQGCEVWLSYYGQGGGQIYYGYTNNSGQIPPQLLTMEHYNETGGNTPYSYGPFRLRLKKGEVEYIQNFTHPGEPMDLIIALQSPEEPPSQGPFFHGHTVDYGSFSLGIQVPKELHPGFFDYVNNRIPLQIDLRLENYQIRSREFQLSYELYDPTGGMRLNGSEILDVGAGEYEVVSLSSVEPFSKRAQPRNYTLSLTVEVGGRKYRSIEWPIRISHEPWAPLIYTSAFLVAVIGLLSMGYGLYHYWPKIKGEAYG